MPRESAQRFFGDRFMVLVNILCSMHKDDLGMVLLFQLDHHFQDILTHSLEAACGEILQERVFRFNAEDRHTLMVFFN